MTGRALGLALVLVALVAPANAAGQTLPWMDSTLPPDERARLVVAAMTLDEKLGLVHGDGACAANGADGWSRGIPRLGIPETDYIGAGAGVTNICARDRLRLVNTAIPPAAATELPAPIARAATWSTDAAARAGRLIGNETRAKGYNVHIGGDINLVRDPRYGRAFETFGEDPLLSGALIVAEQRAVAGEHLVTTVKHYAANENEQYRNTSSSNVDERTLRELYLLPFEMAVTDGAIDTVMCAYNALNGVQACEHRELLTDILKDEWGFKGWVMSDWITATRSTVAAANNGLDQEQPNGVFFGAPLAAAVVAGQVPMARLDDMVHRIVRTLFASGVVDDPPTAGELDVDAGAEVAREVEEQSAVLLKNEGATLPLDPGGTQSVAVIGAHADGSQDTRTSCIGIGGSAPTKGYAFGFGSPYVQPARVVTPLAGLRARLPGAQVDFDAGTDPAAAAALAADRDVAVVFARDTESEGCDRSTLALDDDADAVIAAVAAANPRTIVVLETGGPVTMPWLDEVPAVLEAWYPGQSGGTAIARLLFGDVNPSGKLPVTFPRSEQDLPTAGDPRRWPGEAGQIDYSEGLLMGYRWYDQREVEPLFAFGHGLSYTRFTYSGLRVRRANPDGSATATVRVTNRGQRAGDEVVQAYVGFPPATGEPPSQLKDFERVHLAPGESRTVTLELGPRAFSHWDVDANAWRIGRGCYSLKVGASSRDIRQTAAIAQGGARC